MPSTASISSYISDEIDRWLVAEDPRLRWTHPAVARHRFLPLFLGWVTTLGLRADGTVITWHHEDGIDAIEPCASAFDRRLALFQGVRRFPMLAALIPLRPRRAETCALCAGSGELPDPRLVCQCGGAGWQLPGEAGSSFG